MNRLNIKNRAFWIKAALSLLSILIYSTFFYGIAFGGELPATSAQSGVTVSGPDFGSAPIVAAPRDIYSGLASQMGVSPDTGLKFSDIFGGNNDGENLYAFVYKKINIDPESQGIKEAARFSGLSNKAAEAVRKGSLEPLVHPSETSITQDDLFARLNAFNARVDKRTEELRFETEMEMRSAPTEMFFNGDIEDSGFDLVYDLQVIEQILFAEKSPVRVGSEFKGKIPPIDGNQFVDYDKDLSPNVPASATNPSSGTTNGASGASGTASGTAQDGAATPTGSFGGTDAASPNGPSGSGQNGHFDAPRSPEGDVEDPSFCTDDEALKSALIDAPSSPPLPYAGSGLSNGSGSGSASGANGTGLGSSSNGSDNTNNQATENPLDDPFLNVNGADLKPEDTRSPDEPQGLLDYYNLAPPDNFEKEADCFGPICVEVNFKYKKASSYVPANDHDNCISCSISKIKDNLWNTIKNNLSPNKAPGNVFEMGKCKDSAIPPLGLNIIVLESPVRTPSQDDLISKVQVTDKWNAFKKAYLRGVTIDEYGKDGSGSVSSKNLQEAEDLQRSKSLSDRATELAQSTAGDIVTQSDLQREIDIIVSDELAKIDASVSAFNQGHSAQQSADFYQMLNYEMSKMDNYFRIYKENVEELSNEICPDISSKSDVKQ